MRCPSCQTENRSQAKFCEECAAPLVGTACPNCGATLTPTAKFCSECAHPVGVIAGVRARLGSPQSYTPKHLVEKVLTSRAALEGERKLVTVLFCDIANSTALAERLGPEGMHVLLNDFFDLALGQVHRYEGTINQFLGDGFMALFGAPVAHEDHARRGALTAIGLRRTLHDRAAGGRAGEHDIEVRMGLHTGPVVVGTIGDNLRMDYTAVGDTTHLAARLQQHAAPGQILISEATSRLVRGYVRVEPIAPLVVKGRVEPVTAFKLIGLGPRRSPIEAREDRRLSDFVGRERELGALREALTEAEAGHSQVVGIVGEPGVGKSRLLYEFRRNLVDRRVTYLEGRCLSYGGAIPYLPLQDIVRANCGITDTDSPAEIGEKVRATLTEVGLDPDEGAPYVLQLLGVKEGTERLAQIGPETIKARIFETVRQMTLHGGRRRPLIVAVEDLHWIDKTSEEYFASMVESLAGAFILLLTTSRPGYRPPWIDKSYATQTALRPLSTQESLAMVQSAVRQADLPASAAQTILSKAEGNPFFLEELTRIVIERGGIDSTLAVPDTIQGVLMTRIDRLPDEPKRVLQTASVLGREFSARLLNAVCQDCGALAPHLGELTRLEFIYERADAEEPVYVFKHVLTQDVAYESLLTPRREALHAAAGQALEALYADRLEEASDRLAYHYARTNRADKAVAYLTRLAEKAARSYAHTEAVTALQEALRHVERLPATEQDRRHFDLVLRQALSLFLLGRLQEVLDLFLPQQERLERLQDPSLAGPYYFWLSHTYCILGSRERAGENARRAIEAATRCGDVATLGKTHYVLAVEGLWSSQPQQGVEHGRQAVSLLARTQESYWLGISHWVVGVNHTIMGEFDQALEAAASAQAIGEAIGDPRLQSYAAWNIGWIHATRGECESGIEMCQRAVECSPDPYTAAVALMLLGYAYLEQGDSAAAIPLLEQSVRQFGQFQYAQIQSFASSYLSEAYFQNGDVDQARDLAMKALEMAKGFTFRYGVGWVQRVLGRIAESAGVHAEAEAHLREALDTFATIPARFELGRTYLSLARLDHTQGNRDAVTMHLTEADRVFRSLRLPKHVERTKQLADEFGVLVPEKSTR